jgi:hypothetical protein
LVGRPFCWWAKAVSDAQLDGKNPATSFLSSSGVTAIGDRATKGIQIREWVSFPADCVVLDWSALEGCKALKALPIRSAAEQRAGWLSPDAARSRA